MISLKIKDAWPWLKSQHILYLSLLAILVGVLAAYGALFLRSGIEWVSHLWTGEDMWPATLDNVPWYVFLSAPVVGGLIVGVINTRWLPQGQATVIPGVLEALAERGGKITARKAAGEAAANIVSVGSGASMGREAPTVALGAALSSIVGRKLGLDERQIRVLIGCGVAAGIAASFNAPIAGVLFALEVILADYAIATFSPIVLSSVIATVITRAELGNFPAFTISGYQLVSGWEIPAYILLGVICGLLAALMISMIQRIRGQFVNYVPNRMFRPVAAGLIVGILACMIPAVASIGYNTVDDILLERLEPILLGEQLPLILFLGIIVVAKLFVSVVCRAGDFGGGMIGPSLFVGAAAGGLFGAVAHSMFPSLSETMGAYALVGAGAMMAAALQAPMSTILMVFELSGDYHIMVPLMAACIVATLVKRSFGPSTVLTEHLMEKGIDTDAGLEKSWMRAIKVNQMDWGEVPSVKESVRVDELKREYVSSGKGVVQVVNDEDDMVGIVTFQDLQPWLLDPSLDQLAVAGEVANRDVQVLKEDDSLLEAIRLFDRESFEHVPIVARDNNKKMLGVLSRNAVFSTYHRLIVKHGEGI